MKDLISQTRAWSYRRQLLGQGASGIGEALSGVIGVYSAHPSGPLSLYARVRSFREEDFYRFEKQRQAVRIPAMRLTIHLMPATTAHLGFRACVPDAGDPYWAKRYTQTSRMMPAEKYPGWREGILQAARTPHTAAELRTITGIPEEMIKMVINRIAYEGSLFREGAGSLRSNILSYFAVPEKDRSLYLEYSHEEALQWLAGEYLRAFGPARLKDFQWWAGVTAGRAKAAFAAHETTDLGEGLLLRQKDLPAFESLKIKETGAVELLPQWDCYTMGYAPDGRSRFVSADVRDQVYGSIGATGGNGLGVILIDGMVHGTWDFQFKGTKMTVIPAMFEKPSKKTSELLHARIGDLASLFKAKSLVVEGD
jgi:hypothetical protein